MIARLSRFRLVAVAGILSVGSLVGCRPDGLMTVSGCDLLPGRMFLQSATATAVPGRVIRSLRFRVTPEKRSTRFTNLGGSSFIELRLSMPAGHGAFDCGDQRKPCQATADFIEKKTTDEAYVLAGSAVVSDSGRLSADLKYVWPASVTTPCTEIRFTIEEIAIETDG